MRRKLVVSFVMCLAAAFPTSLWAWPELDGSHTTNSIRYRGAASPEWKKQMGAAVRALPMSVKISYRGRVLFRKDAQNRRPPASVQKPLVSMAMFDRAGNQPSTR
ncbi:MAG: hypothetical protein M3198_01755 [Actinomycetota bacterium]|nr:hypothetical protein [Actinomycetota bacterium]